MLSRAGPLLLAVFVLLLPAIVAVAAGVSPEETWTVAMVGPAALLLAVLVRYLGWWTVVAILTGFPVALAMLLPATCAAREAPYEPWRWRCSTRLGNIACALGGYYREHGSLPPAIIRDDKGRPMHSWRVAILPYFGHEDCDELYRRYDFHQPWDGPDNRRLLTACPEPYMCRDAQPPRQPGDASTSYLAVVDSNSAGPGKKSAALRGPTIVGNRQTTVTIIEVPAAAGVPWTQPRDLALDELQATGECSVKPVTHRHATDNHVFYYYQVIGPPGASVGCFFDGIGGLLPEENLGPEKLRNLLAIGGFDEAAFHSYGMGEPGEWHLRLRRWPCSVFAVWLVPVGLLFTRAARSRKAAGCRNAPALAGNPRSSSCRVGQAQRSPTIDE
jgi:hypothetical protein